MFVTTRAVERYCPLVRFVRIELGHFCKIPLSVCGFGKVFNFGCYYLE